LCFIRSYLVYVRMLLSPRGLTTVTQKTGEYYGVAFGTVINWFLTVFKHTSESPPFQSTVTWYLPLLLD